MRKIFSYIFIVASFGFVAFSAASERWGEIRQPSTVVNIRAERRTDSPVVGKLYPGNRVRVDFLKDEWFAVFRLRDTERDETAALGFVDASYLKPIDDSVNSIVPEAVSLTKNPTANISENFCELEASYDFKALKQLVPKLSKISEPHTGDLPEMISRKTVRVLTPYSMTHYYVLDGRSFGFEFSLLKEYEKFLNESEKFDGVRVSVEFIPLPAKHLLKSLTDGLGDIAVTGSAPSFLDNQDIDFTEAYLEGIDEVVVTNRNLNNIKTPLDLAGKQFYLRPSGGYFKTLAKINELLVDQNLPPARVVKAGAFFNAEDILELLDAGIIELSILESHMAALWSPVFSNIAVYDEIPDATGNSISFVVRRSNPELKQSLNRFLERHRKGTHLGNIFFERYFSDASRVKNPLNAEDRVKFSKYAPLFKKYGELYGFDWMLLAAVAYQESGLDPSKRSPAGAVGLMQLMPGTAGDHRIRMKNISDPETNVHAGVKYLALLREAYFADPAMDPAVRGRFALAAYNAGPGNIIRARKLAFQTGYDPDRWFGHVEYAALRVIGRETVRYVSNINKYYLAYSLSGALDCLKERQKQKVLYAP